MVKLETIAIIQVNTEACNICNLRFNVPNEIFIIFHNGSNYDYHFMIKELAKESKCLLEKYWKIQHFFVQIEKEIKKVDKDGNKYIITITYKIKFIDNDRFIANSLSNLADNLGNAIHKIKCEDYDSFLEYESVNVNYQC